MPYSEVGNVSANEARISWNAQYGELYDEVAVFETDGYRITRMAADADPDTGGDVGLQFDVISGSKYFYRAQLIWVPTTGFSTGVMFSAAGGVPNSGDSIHSRSPASATTLLYRNTRTNDGLLGSSGAAPNVGPIPSVALVVGLHRATSDSTVRLQFRSDANVVFKAGSTLEVMSV